MQKNWNVKATEINRKDVKLLGAIHRIYMRFKFNVVEKRKLNVSQLSSYVRRVMLQKQVQEYKLEGMHDDLIKLHWATRDKVNVLVYKKICIASELANSFNTHCSNHKFFDRFFNLTICSFNGTKTRLLEKEFSNNVTLKIDVKALECIGDELALLYQKKNIENVCKTQACKEIRKSKL